jgi:hypothetical protein
MMKHLSMKVVVACVALLWMARSGSSQAQALWQHSTAEDQLHGKTEEQFTLAGKYLTAPRVAANGSTPLLVVTCSYGHVTANYFSFGAVVNADSSSLFPVLMEERLDDKFGVLPGNAVSTDGTAVYFTRSDLGKILKHRLLVVGADEYLGPKIVAKFEIPDSSALFAACSSDSVLRRIKQ